MVEETGYNICIGGTFSPLHRGHKILLGEAFKRGKRVSVGLTSDGMARAYRDRDVLPYVERSKRLTALMEKLSAEHGVPFSVREIHDRLGFAVKEEIDAIVVSHETQGTVDDIDLERVKRGLPPLKRFVVDMVLDQRGERISSTRIASGEIDNEGKLAVDRQRNGNHGRICLHLGSKNPDKVQGAIRAFRRYWSEVQILQYEVRPGQGRGGVHGPVAGARERVLEVRGRIGPNTDPDRDLVVGIEAGLMEMDGIWFMVHCCYVSFKGGEGFGLGPGLEIPPYMLERIMAYRGRTWETKDILGMRTSLIENLSGGSISRDSIIEHACQMALLSLFNSLKKEETK